MTCYQAVLNYFLANYRRNIPPLCTLKSKDVSHIKGGNKVRNKLIKFMSIIEQEAIQAEVWKERWTDWDAFSLNSM
jgi:hypothetical protein